MEIRIFTNTSFRLTFVSSRNQFTYEENISYRFDARSSSDLGSKRNVYRKGENGYAQHPRQGVFTVHERR